MGNIWLLALGGAEQSWVQNAIIILWNAGQILLALQQLRQREFLAGRYIPVIAFPGMSCGLGCCAWRGSSFNTSGDCYIRSGWNSLHY